MLEFTASQESGIYLTLELGLELEIRFWSGAKIRNPAQEHGAGVELKSAIQLRNLGLEPTLLLSM